jgi:hypothetical protein
MNDSQFGTILITKDRNWCLKRTIDALRGSELLNYPLIVVNNGALLEDPRVVLDDLPHDYIRLQQNIGIVGSRIFAHHLAARRSFKRYCFLQDDFELKEKELWLEDTFEFMDRFKIQFCRLTRREALLGEDEHWAKGVLRVNRGAAQWNCSHIQTPKRERVSNTDFLITDKHYNDWVHIIDLEASRIIFDVTERQLEGPTVCELLNTAAPWAAFHGAVRSEFDFSVKHWIAYSLGMISATGIVASSACWCGLFDHFTGKSTTDYKDLPPDRRQVFLAAAEATAWGRE